MATRLTRVQQQELTHERLLAAALSVFLRNGFLATTVDQVAEAAGYTRGAVYKHFGGKEALWLAVSQSRVRAHVAAIRDALAGAETGSQVVAALTPRAETAEDRAWNLASAEFLAAVSRQSPHAKTAVNSRRTADTQVAACLAIACRRLGISPAISTLDIVHASGALGDGMALRHTVGDTMDSQRIAAGVITVLLQMPPISTDETDAQ